MARTKPLGPLHANHTKSWHQKLLITTRSPWWVNPVISLLSFPFTILSNFKLLKKWIFVENLILYRNHANFKICILNDKGQGKKNLSFWKHYLTSIKDCDVNYFLKCKSKVRSRNPKNTTFQILPYFYILKRDWPRNIWLTISRVFQKERFFCPTL